MSRAHMLYEDKPLLQEGVRTSKWPGRWEPHTLQKGTGVLMEGVFRKKVKHILQDSQGSKYRYVVLHVEFKHGCQRKYDVHGKEIEPNFGQTGIVRTGYLHSSYKTEAKGTPDVLDFKEVEARLRSPLSDFVAPGHAHTLCLWGEEGVYDHVEAEVGQTVRLKTKGDAPFIESLTKLETEQKAHSANYTGGEGAGQSWTDKVMGVKQATPTSAPKEPEGVDEEEWDD